MRGAPILATLLLALPLLASGAADTATTHTRTVDRVVAYPTPYGPVTLLDDGHVWEVDVPTGAQVFVHAKGAPGSLFYLRVHAAGAPSAPHVAAPTAEDGRTLPPGTWRVVADPAGGAAVKIVVTFRGHWADVDAAPAPFALHDVKGGSPCLLPGVCLP